MLSAFQQFLQSENQSIIKIILAFFFWRVSKSPPLEGL